MDKEVKNIAGATREWDNATLIARQDLTGESAIFKIEADAPLFEFLSGQYTTIGLPADAPRVEGADPDEDANGNPRKLIIRAYSIASSSKARDYVELYITLVNSGSLTPRLWMLQPGDRLWLGPKAKGLFMLSLVMALALLTVAVISVAMHLDNKQLGGARRRLRHFGGHRRCNLRGGDGQPPHAYQSLVERIQSLVKRCSSSDMRPAILRWKMFLDSELVSNRTIHVVRVRKVMTAFLVAQAASL
ncbi:MAG: hypothetical protein IID42_10970 [Planctomycetes bacterium]|nr:hypothetical protein [Planctomycetota bacterium]